MCASVDSLGVLVTLFFQNFRLWLDLFDNIVSNWKRLLSVRLPLSFFCIVFVTEFRFRLTIT